MRFSSLGTLIGAAALSLAAFTAANAAELIQNGGFESGSISPWSQDEQFGSGAWVVASGNPNSGTYSASVFGNVGLLQDIADTAVSDITNVSFFIQDRANFNTYAFIYTDGTFDEYFAFPGNTPGYDVVDATSNLLQGKILAAFEVFGNSGATTYLDDVSITTSAAERPSRMDRPNSPRAA